jgi:carboxymethylenebutenolidase
MRWVKLAAVAFVGLGLAVGAAWGQLSGAKGVVNNKLKSVDGYNQAIDDAINGNDPGNNSKPQVNVAPDGIKAGWMNRSRDGKEVRLYFAYPAALNKSKPTAGILVVQEWWGVNDDIQDRTRDFAAKGFYAVAPDLYYGKVTDDATEAAKLKDSMTNAAAMTAMRSGLDLLGEEGRNGLVDMKRVGAVGWCMGGEQALLLSITDIRVKATAIFYGPLVNDPLKLKSLQGPVLGIFGNDDKAPSPADVDQFKTALQMAGKKDVTIYPFDGVGHAFASKSAAKLGAYNETKAKDAFDKMWAWMDAKLPRN